MMPPLTQPSPPRGRGLRPASSRGWSPMLRSGPVGRPLSPLGRGVVVRGGFGNRSFISVDDAWRHVKAQRYRLPRTDPSAMDARAGYGAVAMSAEQAGRGLEVPPAGAARRQDRGFPLPGSPADRRDHGRGSASQTARHARRGAGPGGLRPRASDWPDGAVGPRWSRGPDRKRLAGPVPNDSEAASLARRPREHDPAGFGAGAIRQLRPRRGEAAP